MIDDQNYYFQLAEEWDGASIQQLISIAKHLKEHELMVLRNCKPLPFTKPIQHTVIACDQNDQCLVLTEGQLQVLSVSTIMDQPATKTPLTDEFSKTTTDICPDSLDGHEYVSVRHTDGTLGFIVVSTRCLVFLFNTNDPHNSYPSGEMPTTIKLYESGDPLVLVTTQEVPPGNSLARAIEEGTLLASIFKDTKD